MMKNTYVRAVAHAVKHHSVSLVCRESWNGFTAGQQYEACAAGTVLVANDDHGLDTKITETVAHFFDVADGIELAVEPSEEESRAEREKASAAVLRERLAMFVPPATKFLKGEVLGWKPGLCNRRLPSEGALMIAVEHLDEPLPNDESLSSANGLDVYDLKVACIARSSGRDDDTCMVEVVVDSRRVQRWGECK